MRLVAEETAGGEVSGDDGDRLVTAETAGRVVSGAIGLIAVSRDGRQLGEGPKEMTDSLQQR